MRSWWVKVWTSSYTEASTAKSPCAQSHHYQTQAQSCLGKPDAESRTVHNNLPFYIGIYFALSIGECLISTFKSFYVFSLAIRGSRNLFEAMTYAILRTPLRWIDTVPVGRILNRFTADFNIVDSNLASDLSFTMESMLHVLAILVAGSFVSPFIISGSALFVVAVYIARRYLAGAREINRLESNANSPIFEQVCLLQILG
jgi:ABC-type multidrug transport system fused ATPase/permease subunit